MWFIHGGRATGKTTILLKQSAATGIPIMTAIYERISMYKDMARDMGIKIPQPIFWSYGRRLLSEGRYPLADGRVLIDDVEIFLDRVLIQSAGVRVEGATIFGELYELGRGTHDTFTDEALLADPVMRLEEIKRFVYGEWETKQSEESNGA